MNIGKLKYRVTFRQPTKTQDSTGSYSVTYADAFSTWADVKQASSSVSVGSGKVLEYGQVMTESAYKIIIRARSQDFEPNQNWLIVYNGKTLAIKNVVEIDRNHLEITAAQDKRAETGNIGTNWVQS